MQKEMIIWKTK